MHLLVRKPEARVSRWPNWISDTNFLNFFSRFDQHFRRLNSVPWLFCCSTAPMTVHKSSWLQVQCDSGAIPTQSAGLQLSATTARASNIDIWVDALNMLLWISTAHRTPCYQFWVLSMGGRHHGSAFWWGANRHGILEWVRSIKKEDARRLTEDNALSDSSELSPKRIWAKIDWNSKGL